MIKKREKGQVLLIVVLVMVVGLTVGLSIVSRSVVNLRTATEEADAQRALSAAEAGIEQASKTHKEASGQFRIPSAQPVTYRATVDEIGGTNFLVAGGNLILPGEGIDVWLVNHDSNGVPIYSSPWQGRDLIVYWGVSNNSCDNAALEIAVVSGIRTAPTLTRDAFDPCESRQRGQRGQRGNNFRSVIGSDLGTFSIGGKNFYYRVRIGNIDSGLIVRIVPIYKSTRLAVESGGQTSLPSQGFLISSTGESGTTKRKIVFFKAYEQLFPQFFLYGLFSP